MVVNRQQADMKCSSEYVLKRDATSITVDSACVATSGSWKSPYDGATWTAASDLDIDHMVPLKNAWVVSSPPHLTPTPLPLPAILFPLLTTHAPSVRRLLMDDLQARAVRQRRDAAAALGSHRQRQLVQGGQEPGLLEAAAQFVLLHVRQELGAGQELLGFECYVC